RPRRPLLLLRDPAAVAALPDLPRDGGRSADDHDQRLRLAADGADLRLRDRVRDAGADRAAGDAGPRVARDADVLPPVRDAGDPDRLGDPRAAGPGVARGAGAAGVRD